jgi:hypothetical protein
MSYDDDAFEDRRRERHYGRNENGWTGDGDEDDDLSPLTSPSQSLSPSTPSPLHRAINTPKKKPQSDHFSQLQAVKLPAGPALITPTTLKHSKIAPIPPTPASPRAPLSPFISSSAAARF